MNDQCYVSRIQNEESQRSFSQYLNQSAKRRRLALDSCSQDCSSKCVTNIRADRIETITHKTKKEIVAIGASTGGPTALSTLLRSFAKDFPVPIVIVQHMPAEFTKRLACRLNDVCEIEVAEALDGDCVEPGVAYIAPGGLHMSLYRHNNKTRVRVFDEPPVNSCRLP